MSMGPLRVIVLAAQRKGVIDPLATKFATSHKCLVPLDGRPLIAHVLETLSRHPRVSEIVVSVEPALFADIARIANRGGMGEKVRSMPSSDNIADSVIAAARGHDGPILITTADNALLTPKSVNVMADALALGDAAMAFAPERAVHAAHVDGQRRFYRFRDGSYSNCNLYGLADQSALAAAEIFRGGGQFAKKARRIIEAFGLLNLMLLNWRLVSMEQGLARISRRIGIGIVPVILSDGTQAIDVDNERTYRVVSEILARRSLAHARVEIADRVKDHDREGPRSSLGYATLATFGPELSKQLPASMRPMGSATQPISSTAFMRKTTDRL